MKQSAILALLLALAMLIPSSESMGGRRGGGGARGGGGGAGGRVVQSYGGGGGAAVRSATPVVGPRGGSGQVVKSGGSYTTKGGSTIDYRGATAGGIGAGGGAGAKHIGGIQVTTPGGKELTHVGRSGAAVGPGGKAVAGKSGTTVGTGPGGSFATKYKGGVAIGPQGVAAGGTRVGAVSGPGGTAVGARHAGAAVGPYGAVAGRTTVAAGARGTYYRSTTAIRGQGVYVRQAVSTYPCFRGNWYAQYPGAWRAAAWTTAAIWSAATWSSCASYGYPEEPVYYDYGSNVVYQDDGVSVDGQVVATAEEYAEQATALAGAGQEANVTKDEEWLPLGIFAMVQAEETTSNHIFQLSINKAGVIRGNYYDAVTDSTTQLFGSADKKTQRAAWTVGDRKSPVYEVGLANLTKDETTMLVHYSPERSQQFSLVRVEAPEEEKK